MATPRKKPPAITTAADSSSIAMMKRAASFIRKGGNISIFAVIAFIFLFATVMIYSEDIRAIAQYSFSRSKAQEDMAVPLLFTNPNSSPQPQNPDGAGAGEVFVPPPESCDLTQGYWAYDNVSRPLYREHQCEFMSQQVTCLQNGRKEDLYQKWRWQPIGCSLPKFDARLLMEKLRGKRLMFVGDSLNRNQWESLVCLLHTAAPPPSPGKNRKTSDGSRQIYTVEDYNATVEFYWAPFLVESNSDDPRIHSIDKRIIDAGSIEKHGEHWKDVDYLVFNTYIWWMNTKDMRVLLRSEGGRIWSEYEKIVRGEAYRRVMRTWSNWVEKNVDPKKSSVFFMSMSPLHIQSKSWGDPNGIKCAKETLPIFNMTGVYVGTDMSLFRIAGEVARSTPAVRFIDITTMSERRKDGHTSVHTVRQGALLTPEQQADPAAYADCIHWCLPGLPDTWNELLFAYILSGR